MKQILHMGAVLAAGALSAMAVVASPAIVYDMGGKFDKSFNESAYNGAERWRVETGGEYREIEIQSEAQREQALRRLAEAGSNPVVMTGFAFGSVLENVAPDYPETSFTIVDMYVDQPNVTSILFKEHEGSFLVGLVAGLTTDSNVVGFVGGMDIPLIRRFACGYVQGVKAVNPDIEVIQNMTGNDPSAWNDPVKGAELTRAQIASGADVVYHAAGGTGVGVLQTAADEGILGIGVDSNQNHLHPGSVLTSMIKRVDNAVFDAFMTGPTAGRVTIIGLTEGGVGYALDENNRALISPVIEAMVNGASMAIQNGDFMVHDYTTDDSCPVS